jgi:hypothetical protein
MKKLWLLLLFPVLFCVAVLANNKFLATCPYDGANAVATGNTKFVGDVNYCQYRHNQDVFWLVCPKDDAVSVSPVSSSARQAENYREGYVIGQGIGQGLGNVVLRVRLHNYCKTHRGEDVTFYTADLKHHATFHCK